MAFTSPAAENALGYKPNKSDRKNAGEWKKVWGLFVGKMNLIQGRLHKKVQESQEESILSKAQTLENDVEFQNAIRDQHARFDAFKLWA